MVDYDRKTAARFNISPQLIDDVLYDAFGQRQVSTMYSSLNQYHVVMEAAPQILAESQHAASGVCLFADWNGSSLERHRENGNRHRAPVGNPSRAVSRDHAVVQPAARRGVGHGGE